MYFQQLDVTLITQADSYSDHINYKKMTKNNTIYKKNGVKT